MKKQLRIATVFSGIGAPEAALKQFLHFAPRQFIISVIDKYPLWQE